MGGASQPVGPACLCMFIYAHACAVDNSPVNSRVLLRFSNRERVESRAERYMYEFSFGGEAHHYAKRIADSAKGFLLNHSVLRGRKRLGHPSRHVSAAVWGGRETVGHISHGFYIHN